MQAGVGQAAPDRGQPAHVRSTPSITRGQRLHVERLLARTAGYEIRLTRDEAGTAYAAKSVRRGAHGAWAAALERERAALERVRAPNVVAAAGFVVTRLGPTLLLEHLGGGDLVSLRGFDARHWLRAARDAAAGLEALHARGLAHRDVKARHVRLAADGRARLIDLGSAAELGSAATRAGTTAAHRRPGAAPHVTAADDAYAFAVLLYELMAGRLPFGAAPGSDAAAPAPLAPAPGLEPLAARVMRTLGSGASEPASVPELAAAIDAALRARAGRA